MTIVMESNGARKFFGHSLRERRANVLSDFHFARENGNRAAFRDVQPRGNIFRRGLPTTAASAGFALLLLRDARLC